MSPITTKGPALARRPLQAVTHPPQNRQPRCKAPAQPRQPLSAYEAAQHLRLPCWVVRERMALPSDNPHSLQPFLTAGGRLLPSLKDWFDPPQEPIRSGRSVEERALAKVFGRRA